jgi:2-polyprenyl-3-methyl-5-hydroxy-6-metoxy-1,4-benzoquinol methylase
MNSCNLETALGFGEILMEADNNIFKVQSSGVPDLFDKVPLDVFGSLLLDIPTCYPNLKQFFPTMPDNQIQINWTGASGPELLKQSTAFIRSVICSYQNYTEKDLRNSNILDYGCGWGRLTRLLYKYCDYNKIFALDPWKESIDFCTSNRLLGNIKLCQEVPKDLPVGDVKFDLVICFSVFTHLSERCHRQVLQVLRRYINESGMLAMTIRPPTYWDYHLGAWQGSDLVHFPLRDASEMKRIHDQKGFAFIPHNRLPINGDITFGDTSISLDYIHSNWKEWRLINTDINYCDPTQLYLFLSPI